MKTPSRRLSMAGAVFALWIAAQPAFAVENIVRPWRSIRSASMGGARYTTGLYDDNFYGNPARVTANPIWKITIGEGTVETTRESYQAISGLAKGGLGNTSALLGNVAGLAGENIHARAQVSALSGYFPGEDLSFAFGLLGMAEANIALRRSYNLEPNLVTDAGPAVTFGHKLLADRSLSIGATAHANHRISTPQSIPLTGLVQGQSINPLDSAGQGAHYDFDGGVMYRLPVNPWDMDISVGAAVNNVLGGQYKNLSKTARLGKFSGPVRTQPTSGGTGVSLERGDLWIFDRATMAFEVSDIGNNGKGSFTRMTHWGTELKLGVLAGRVGLNQGYWGGGLGLDLSVLLIDVATYGEEMSLNAGGLESRNYAVRVALEI